MQVTWLPFLLVIFMVRGGFANSTSPIDRSILMDYTPSTQRGVRGKDVTNLDAFVECKHDAEVLRIGHRQ
ncbi:unnamed protein product, partial [Symbiodinium microadriaticum]